MSTIALKGKAYTEGRNRVSLKERIAEYFRTTMEEYGAEIACGMLAMSGNTNAALVYQMLKK
ncbi:MAG: hypothetical protein K2O16_20705 [Lachnospiraceae bacterium]|nr:hypothetical protein [Lachnospiraceae bacterium]